MANFSIVVAMGEDGSLGYFNKQKNKYDLPWDCKTDMDFFKNLTTTNLTGTIPSPKNVVIMGKNTYLSLPIKILPNRINIVISSSYNEWRDDAHKNLIVFLDFDTALNYCSSMQYKNIYVIGGSKLYEEALTHKNMKKIIVSIIPHSYFKDKVLPTIFFPYSLKELDKYSTKTLLYKKRFLNVYSYE